MTGLPKMVSALLKPEAYPEATERVEMVQTQMSFVFLADRFVYKVKKPVNLGYLDYTTLESRRLYCHKEVELNQRLCPDIYHGVVAITRHRDSYSLGDQGRPVEYAVKMSRLPGDKMMDVLLRQNRVSTEMIGRLAEKLADFHRRAETSPEISAFGRLAAIRQNTEESFSQTEQYIGKVIPRLQHRRTRDYTRNFIDDNAALFEGRVTDGRIRDCHGDLHTAHVCFSDGICIYDCIEFNDRFRYGDVASEVAFLVMDLDHHGRADLGRSFVNTYTELSQDEELKKLLNFYRSYRAYVRGKVACFKLDDPYTSEEERTKTLQTATSYFELANSYTKSTPLLIITAGLVGSGKTALSRALAEWLGLAVISSDTTRKRLASIPETEHRFEEFDTGIYSPEFSQKTYHTMLNEARSLLNEGSPVIIDASFARSEERLKAKSLARETNSRFFIVECILGEGLTRKRLARRLEQGSASDGRWEIYQQQKGQFEQIIEVPSQNHLVIDSSQPVTASVRHVLNLLDEE